MSMTKICEKNIRRYLKKVNDAHRVLFLNWMIIGQFISCFELISDQLSPISTEYFRSFVHAFNFSKDYNLIVKNVYR